MNTDSIVIDTRESNETVQTMFDRQHEFPVEIKKLEIGDVAFQGCCIERKTPSDFMGSIRKSNFWNNMLSIKSNYAIPILWIDGTNEDWKRIFSRIRSDSYNSYQGAKAAIVMNGIPICEFENRRDARNFFLTLFSKISDKKEFQAPLEIRKKGRSQTELKLQSIACVPTIGMKTALGLLTKYKSIERLIVASKKSNDKKLNKIEEFFCK